MTRLVLILALIGSLVAAARAEGVENLPATIAIKGGVPVARLQAAGAQIYVCARNTAGALNWRFREPVATLLEEGKTVGRHFVGPTWEFDDGSRVAGELVSKAPGATAKDVRLVETLSQRTPEIRSRRRRNIGLTHRHEGGRLRGSLRQRRRTAFGAVCRDLRIRKIKASARMVGTPEPTFCGRCGTPFSSARAGQAGRF